MDQPTCAPFNRRRMLALGLGLGASAAFARTANAELLATGVTAPVKTSNGPVIGLVMEGVQTFRGLRYGAAPTGALRFAPPQRPTPWAAPAAAIRYGNAAMQLSTGGSAVAYPGIVGIALDQGLSSLDDVQRMHEDCLFLNVWTPATDAAKRPVMVWLHGGGFNYGSGAWPFYDGHNLAKNHDVVVVTVNHRLNVFGYLNVADIGGDRASGNAGMLDCVAALEWVRDNIAGFGGDPKSVTIFGQSGGGGKVCTLMAMPSAKGLFHRAIVESGPGLRAGDKAAAAAATQAIMKAAGASDLKGLQALPGERLLSLAASREVQGGLGGLRWGPILDGAAIPAHPFDPVANPLGAGVPVMVGCTMNEQTLYNVGFPWWGKLTDSELVEKVKALPGGKGEKLLAAYRKLYPDHSPSYLFTDVAGAGFAFNGSVTLAERKAKAKAAPAYFYMWEWGAPVEGGVLKAPHTMEIPFVFDNVDKGPLLLGTAASTKALGKRASDTWVAFARTGDPNHAGIPHWPAYDASKRPTMIFNIESRVENDPWAEVRKILQAK
jgi:para-nitrobenzyl esterase